MSIDGEAIELLETQNQRVEDRRADLVARIRGGDGEEFLLYAEIADKNTPDMALRMLRYYTDIRFAGHRGPIRQFLIYIGSDRLTMLEVLSENRDLKAQVEEAEYILTEIDVERLPSFAIGFERGEAKGKAIGEAQGEARIVSRLLRRLGMAKASESLGLPPEEVERIIASGDDIDEG